jgi:integrase
MVLCALTTGLRRSELLGLRWEWIDFSAGVIDLSGQLYWPPRSNVPLTRRCKYDSERQVPLYPAVGAYLEERCKPSGWVFTDPFTGDAWRPERASKHVLLPAYHGAELRRQGQMWHPLRHTYASILAAGGVRRHQIEQLMGHVGSGTTSIYTHLFRESYETVLAALDMVFSPLVDQR